MKADIVSIALESAVHTEYVIFVVTLFNKGRMATFRRKAQFGMPHSDGQVDSIRLGEELTIGVDVTKAEWKSDTDIDGYPCGWVTFPIKAIYEVECPNNPGVWAEGFSVTEKKSTKINPLAREQKRTVNYSVQITVPHAAYAYLDGHLNKLHKDELI